MPRISGFVLFIIVTVLGAGLIGVSANDKKDAKKDDKKEEKKIDDKKEEKKEPFKPDPAEIELKYLDKEKSFWVYDVAFGPDGKTLAAAYRPHTVVVWDLQAKKESKVIKGPVLRGLGDFRSLVYSGDTIYAGTGTLIKKDKDKKDKEPLEKKPIEKGKDKTPVKDVSIRDGEIKIWNAKTGEPGTSMIGHTDNIECLALSKDSKILASGSKDATVRIWNIGRTASAPIIKGHTDDILSVAFSPDGKHLVTTSMDKTVRVWIIDKPEASEIASFKVEREVEKKDPKGKVTKVKEVGREFTKAVFAKDGKSVIAVNRDGQIKIYEIEGKKELQELKAHEGILALALSPDGSKFATGGYDQCIKIWDADKGTELRTIKAHLGTVTALQFSPDGNWLASGSIDGTVKLWNIK